MLENVSIDVGKCWHKTLKNFNFFPVKTCIFSDKVGQNKCESVTKSVTKKTYLILDYNYNYKFRMVKMQSKPSKAKHQTAQNSTEKNVDILEL